MLCLFGILGLQPWKQMPHQFKRKVHRGDVQCPSYILFISMNSTSSLAGILMHHVKTVRCTVTILVYLGNQCFDHCSFVQVDRHEIHQDHVEKATAVNQSMVVSGSLNRW